jgi:hypothetical protein
MAEKRASCLLASFKCGVWIRTTYLLGEALYGILRLMAEKRASCLLASFKCGVWIRTTYLLGEALYGILIRLRRTKVLSFFRDCARKKWPLRGSRGAQQRLSKL